MEIGNASGYERYRRLVSVLGGLPADPGMGPAVEWLIAGLRADRT
ncbi:hypothetical protein [Streptomyces sp. NPDC002537]